MTQRSPSRHDVDRSVVQTRPSRGIFHDIRSPGLFAKYPMVGLSMFLFGGAVFGLMAYNFVTGGPLLAWDLPVAKSMHATALHGPEWARNLAIAGYYVGDQLIAVIGVLFAIYFLRKRCWRELTMVTFGFGISALLFLLLAYTFDRPRPTLEPELWGGPPWSAAGSHLPGFPSGHAMAVISSYGLLVYFLLPRIRSRSRKVLVIAGFVLVGVYVNFSRLFLCDHFLSDIVAGTAFGIAWMGLAQTAVELLFRKRPPWSA